MSLYEQRRGHVQQRLGNLASLESACENSWEEQKYLQDSCECLHDVVHKCYQEMWLRGQQVYEEVKQDLEHMRGQLEQLIPTFK